MGKQDDLDGLAELGELIRSGRARQLREKAGISGSELARRLDVTPGAVLRWETGERRPQGANARRYARVLRRLADREAATS